MSDAMSFPATVEEFMEQYKIVDCDHVYSNGMEMVPIFRMKQWFEHEALKKAPTALDHIHNVVRDDAYRRGYEQGKKDVPDMNDGDMISRQVAMEMLMAQNVIMDGSEYHNGFNAGVNRAQEVIRNLPPVQPKQMNGEWNKIHWKAFRCSECNRVSEYHTNFCPNCGADMRGGEV